MISEWAGGALTSSNRCSRCPGTPIKCYHRVVARFCEGVLCMAMDPVCKLKIEPSHADGTSVYKGRTYYFCSLSCKGYFDRNPAKYAFKPEGKPGTKERIRNIFLTDK